MKRKILVVFVVCFGLMALFPNGESGTSGIITISGEHYTWHGEAVVISNNTDDGFNPYWNNVYIANESTAQHRWIIQPKGLDVNSSEVTRFTLRTAPVGWTNPGNVSVHLLIHPWGANLKTDQANWTNSATTQAWNSPGGDYNPVPMDTKYIDDNDWVTFEITDYINLSVADQTGLIFIAEDDCNVTFQMAYNIILMDLYYTSGSGQSTNILKDVWNLKGFAGGSPKLASTIYSEISDCLALSWKNATTGYWYTYYPSLGLTEDTNLNFGDGLFILTDQDTTWDHT